MNDCPMCESIEIIKYGFNYLRDHKIQKYRCLSCRRIFSDFYKLPNNQFTIEIVSKCLDLYCQGLSYRVIARHLLENQNIKINHTTIYYWIQTYSALIKKYVDQFKPRLSAVWQADETFIAFKGKKLHTKIASPQKGHYCWIMVDTGSRFILNMHLGQDKSLEEGMAFFEKIKNTFPDIPAVITTDGYISYQTCIKRLYPGTKHILLELVTIKPNTSIIERFNGTVKNRTKTMRCFDEFIPCQNWITLFQVYYNFLRPHTALNGKTPAQEAGIDLHLPNRWASLIQHALLVVTH